MSPSVLTACALCARSFLDAAAKTPSVEFPLSRTGDTWHVAVAHLPRSGVRYGALRCRCCRAQLRGCGRSPPPPCCCAQASRSAATAGGKRATGGIRTSCFWTRACPFAPERGSLGFSSCSTAAAHLTHHVMSSSYAPLVAGRDKFADKAFPPGPGTFTGTFDFESASVRLPGACWRRWHVAEACAAVRAVRLARGEAAGSPGCVRSGHALRVLVC